MFEERIIQLLRQLRVDCSPETVQQLLDVVCEGLRKGIDALKNGKYLDADVLFVEIWAALMYPVVSR